MHMNTTIPEGYVLHMPPLKHNFYGVVPVSVPAHASKSGHPQTERTCKTCGAVKVTLHIGDDGGRAWRASADGAQVETFVAPSCVPVGTKAEQ